MPTVAELITARLSATGMEAKLATRLTGLILKDMRSAGLTVVQTRQLDLLGAELTTAAGGLKILADAWLRIEQQRPA